MFGLGKPRSKFGKKLDKHGVNQLDLENASGLSRGTISKVCNDKEYTPKVATLEKIKRGLRKLGENPNDYFDA